jgi:hypothetical protein
VIACLVHLQVVAAQSWIVGGDNLSSEWSPPCAEVRAGFDTEHLVFVDVDAAESKRALVEALGWMGS